MVVNFNMFCVLINTKLREILALLISQYIRIGEDEGTPMSASNQQPYNLSGGGSHSTILYLSRRTRNNNQFLTLSRNK